MNADVTAFLNGLSPRIRDLVSAVRAVVRRTVLLVRSLSCGTASRTIAQR